MLAPFKWCVGPDLCVSLFIGGFFSSWAGDCHLCSAPCGYGKRLLVCRWVQCARWGLPLRISISYPGRNHPLGLNFLVSLCLSAHTNGFISGTNTRDPCWLVKWRTRANSPRDLSTSSGHPLHTFSINDALGTPWVSPSTSLLSKSNVFWILGLAGFTFSVTLILYSFCCVENHQHFLFTGTALVFSALRSILFFCPTRLTWHFVGCGMGKGTHVAQTYLPQ